MRKSLARSMVVVTMPALLMLAPSARADGPPPAAQDKGAERGSRLHVSTLINGSTAVSFGSHEKAPPPWPKGNCFSLMTLSPDELRERVASGAYLRPEEKLFVINMHAENFKEVCRVLGLEKVEIERVGVGRCLVVDRRIAREWLRDRPCRTCVGAKQCEEVPAKYPDAFREATR